jgi:hypothetical protein
VIWVLIAPYTLFAVLLALDNRLGVLTWLFNEGPDSTSMSAGLFMLSLVPWAFVCCEVGLLRQRVDALERRVREQDSQQQRERQ